MIYKTKKDFFKALVALFLIAGLLSCSLSTPEKKKSWTSSTVKTTVSQAIDEEMEFIKPNLDPELQSKIDNGQSKGKPLTGKDIVELIDMEQYGSDYLGFCYTVSTDGSDSGIVRENARNLISDEQFRDLEQRSEEIEKKFAQLGDEFAKDLPENQKEAFYKDLKSLVVRTVVLLTAGIVYIAIPDLVLWGKVSAAAAIAVGAGLVANAMMTIYEKYRFGIDENDPSKSPEDWMRELIQVPKADFALTTSAATLAATYSESPVVKGIVILVFAAVNVYQTIQVMLKTYNFNA